MGQMRARSPVTRSQFLRLAAGGVLGSFVIVTVACGGGDDEPTLDGPAIDAPPVDGPDPDASPIDASPIDASPIDAAIDAPPGACSPETTIASNHGHVLTVSAADVTAGQPRTYDIMGGAGHGHSVTLTAAHFQMLAQNQPVTVTSTVTLHSHSITVRCA
jgi:hypothetical protein